MSLVLALVSLASAADTVAQQNGKAAYQAALDQEVAEVNAACGSRLKATYDWTTYPSFDPLTDRTQSACQQAIGTLAALCATDAGKTAVRAIPRATCRWSDHGTLVRRGEGALQVHVDPAKTAIVGKQPGSYSWKSALEEVL